MKYNILEWSDIDCAINSIFYDIYHSDWKPEVVVGISPSGVIPALILNNRLRTEFETITIDFARETPITEVNTWLPELAFGINDQQITGISGARWDPSLRKNILIFLTENNDKTIEFIISDWQSSCYPNEKETWKKVWNKNVRFACIHENPNVKKSCDYWWNENHPEDKIKNIYPWTTEYWTKKL